MKLINKLLITLCTVTILVCCILFPASADVVTESEPFRYGKPNEMLSEISPKARVAPGLERMLFSFRGDDVSGLFTTYGTTKFFEKKNIPENGYIFYVGQLSSTYYSEAGICYISQNDGERIAVTRTRFEPGKITTSSNYSPSLLRSDRKYYGYIKRASGVGSVSGYVQYYYLDPNS